MPQFQDDPLPLQHWLNIQPGGLREVLSRARQISEFNQALRQFSDEPWLAQIHVANIRNGTLVLFSSSAAALVVLRNRQKKLLEFLHQRFPSACIAIEARVRPDATAQP